MPIVRISLKNINVKRLLHYNKRSPKALDVIGDMRAIDVRTIGKDKLRITFDVIFRMREKGKGDTELLESRLEIYALCREEESTIKKTMDSWKKERELTQEMFSRAANRSFRFAVLTMLPITERMRLPPIVPLPSLNPSKKK